MANTFMNIAVVDTFNKAKALGRAFIGWTPSDTEFCPGYDILGLYDQGMFILLWAAPEYLKKGTSKWVEEYTVRDESLLIVERLAEAYFDAYASNKDDYRHGHRPGHNNWSDIHLLLTEGIVISKDMDPICGSIAPNICACVVRHNGFEAYIPYVDVDDYLDKYPETTLMREEILPVEDEPNYYQWR